MQHDFILLDRSGSMEALWGEALSSINAYVAKLSADKVDTGVTLAAFDAIDGSSSFEIVRDRIIPATWMAVTANEIMPRGMTPLNDATGRIVNLARAGNYEKVAIIIMTDGMENASVELTVSQAKALLDDCRAKNWQVIFLGANFDNAKQARGYGNSQAATIQAAPAALVRTMQSAAVQRGVYATSGSAMAWSEAEKQELGSGDKADLGKSDSAAEVDGVSTWKRAWQRLTATGH